MARAEQQKPPGDSNISSITRTNTAEANGPNSVQPPSNDSTRSELSRLESLPRELRDAIYFYLGFPVAGRCLHLCDQDCSCIRYFVGDRQQEYRRSMRRLPGLSLSPVSKLALHCAPSDTNYQPVRLLRDSTVLRDSSANSPFPIQLSEKIFFNRNEYGLCKIIMTGKDAEGKDCTHYFPNSCGLTFTNRNFYFELQTLLYQGACRFNGPLQLPMLMQNLNAHAVFLAIDDKPSTPGQTDFSSSNLQLDVLIAEDGEQALHIAFYTPLIQSHLQLLAITNSSYYRPDIELKSSLDLKHSIRGMIKGVERLETITVQFGRKEPTTKVVLPLDGVTNTTYRETRIFRLLGEALKDITS
ncbi:hypothetical protein BDV96DRAFT_594930 [Lophiotrema nucula]|uniref:Uncharacterized protein n=1 Tax=Lophiotrema nucula TaxID=690887 RepID=A0A6A5ZQC6_9PLEO|nr:hypothetical protein BDV96DRAFT_594930 [Lophiotrema nucula]